MTFFTQASPSPSPSESTGSSDGLGGWFENLGDGALEFGRIVLVCLILYIIGRLVIRAISRSIEKGLPLSRPARQALAQAKLASPQMGGQDAALEYERKRKRALTIRAVLNSALAVLIVTIIIASLLTWVGVPLAPLLASAGIVGVALGFGAQSLVKDVLSGMFMLLEDQYGVGDVIDVGSAQGTVEEFGLRSTRLRSLDGTVWYVPNGEILRVGNMTRIWSRALVEVRLAYDTDVEQARDALFEATAAARERHPEVDAAILSEPEIPGVESLDYDALVMRVILQVTPGSQWTVMRAIRIELRRTLKEHNITVARPQRTLYLDDKQGPHPREDDEPL